MTFKGGFWDLKSLDRKVVPVRSRSPAPKEISLVFRSPPKERPHSRSLLTFGNRDHCSITTPIHSRDEDNPVIPLDPSGSHPRRAFRILRDFVDALGDQQSVLPVPSGIMETSTNRGAKKWTRTKASPILSDRIAANFSRYS